MKVCGYYIRGVNIYCYNDFEIILRGSRFIDYELVYFVVFDRFCLWGKYFDLELELFINL